MRSIDRDGSRKNLAASIGVALGGLIAVLGGAAERMDDGALAGRGVVSV
jgi:hypothetical protein